jgi:hypothetical protein
VPRPAGSRSALWSWGAGGTLFGPSLCYALLRAGVACLPSGRKLWMELCETLRSLLASTVGLAVRPLCVLDPHLDPLRQPRVAVPELRTSRRDRSRQAIAGHTVHLILRLAHLFDSRWAQSSSVPDARFSCHRTVPFDAATMPPSQPMAVFPSGPNESVAGTRSPAPRRPRGYHRSRSERGLPHPATARATCPVDAQGG